MKIAIIGGTNVVHKNRKVKDLLFKIKQHFGTMVTVASGGNTSGIEYVVKQTALEFGMAYVEYNPSFSGYNQYSGCEKEYYNKSYHYSHYFDRYKKMLSNIDKLIVGVEEGVNDPIIKQTLRMAEKFKIPVVLI